MTGRNKITAFILSLMMLISSAAVYAAEDKNSIDSITEAEATEAITEEAIKEETEEITEEVSEAPVDTERWYSKIENGACYNVDVKMYRWPYAEPPSYSMGNGALKGNAKLVKENDRFYTEINFKAIDMGSTTGHLVRFWSIPKQETAATSADMYAALENLGIPAEEQSVSCYLEECAEECEYIYKDNGDIDYIRMPIDPSQNRIICGLESDFAVMGRQLCVMSFDYSAVIEEVTGIAVERVKQVGTPNISSILSADGESFEYI